MGSPFLGDHKTSLLTFMMLLIFVVEQTQGVCIEYERKALLEIKASLHESSYRFDVNNLLSTWVDHGDCCDWERINCNTTTGYITDLYLSNVFNMFFRVYGSELNFDLRWSINFSPFLRFKDLKSLDLSCNFIDNTIVSTGLGSLSSLNKLEILNLSTNNIEANIFPLVSALTSLKTLDLSYFNGYQFSPTYDISEFSVAENLEVLHLTCCGYYGTLQIQVLSNFTNLKTLDLSCNKLNILPSIEGCKSLMRLERLESVSLGDNNFNKSVISCLSFLPSLKILDLSYSSTLGTDFPIEELSSLRELKTLDLSYSRLTSFTLNGTMSNLVHLNLDWNFFNDAIMSSMAAFPSLRYLSLESGGMGGRLFTNEVPNMPYLEVLLLRLNDLKGTLPMEALASFNRLKVLDLSYNNFVGNIPSEIKSLSALEVVSFAYNALNGSLADNTGLCELKNLRELDISNNMLDGNLPTCFSRLSSLKMFDISSNQFNGMLPPYLIANLTSLEFINFGLNKFEGLFSISSLSNHTKLEFFQLEGDNGKLEVETEEPIGWIPMFQLKVLVLSNCNIRRLKGSVVPSFLLHQHKLQVLDLAHNSLEGQFPNWLLKNNTKLEVLILRNNSFQGVMPLAYLNANTRFLDMSENHMTGNIPKNIHKFIPYIYYLDFSSNALNGFIPGSICDLSELHTLDLSQNKISGGVPKGLFTNVSKLQVIKLSKNSLHGQILSGNLSLGSIRVLRLDGNFFTGNIGNNILEAQDLSVLDISYNLFTGIIPSWISNLPRIVELIVRSNNLEGQFPCGKAPLSFLDISQNFFSGPIPNCINLEHMQHFHLSSNRFTGLVPNVFRNLTNVSTLDIGHNNFSGEIPEFLGDLSKLRILLLSKNNFSGPIPKQLCRLTNMSFIDLSSNSLSGLIPRCLQYNIGPEKLFSTQDSVEYKRHIFYIYDSAIHSYYSTEELYQVETQDVAQFTTKRNSLTYKGKILDDMSGLDLSCNKLIGEIPEELGKLTQILVLNLSHNMLTGPIPVNLSNLIKLESLDLSSNGLTGKVPSELIQLNFLAVFNVSYNNLSGKLPEWKAQFATFTKESYEGNPLLCGPPLENKCITDTQVTHPSDEEGTNENWYDIDITSFYGSSGTTWFVFMLGFAALLYINPYWRRKWLEFIEESMYTCYFFFCDLVRKPYVILCN